MIDLYQRLWNQPYQPEPGYHPIDPERIAFREMVRGVAIRATRVL